jgi:Plavaka transposase
MASIFYAEMERRLCFPRLCQYIADYEELRLLAGILSGYCPKCTIPVFNHKEPEHNVLAERENYPLRDGDDVLRLIKAYLDCHRMAHYESHTDSEGREGRVQGTVQLLQRAVDVFWDELMNPEGVFRKARHCQRGLVHYEIASNASLRREHTTKRLATSV